MPDTYTTALDLIKQAFDSNNNAWGGNLNTGVMDKIDEAFRAKSHATTGGTTVLTVDDVRFAIHVITGTLASNAIFEVPAARTKWFAVKNETTGSYTVTWKVNGQTGIVIAQGETKWLRCNGTDVVDLNMASVGAISGRARYIGSLSFSSNAYSAAANNMLPAALVDGMEVTAFIANANTSTTPTLNYASTGAKTIVHANGSALANGDMPANSVMSFVYVLASDKWFIKARVTATSLDTSGANTWALRQTLTLGDVVTPGSLSDGASIAWDMAAKSTNVQVTLGGNRTLANPTNTTVGQMGTILITQDGTGSRTLALGSSYKSPNAETLLLESAANGRSLLGYYVVSSTVIIVWTIWKENRNSIGTYKEYDMGTVSFPSNKTQAHGLGRYPAAVEIYLQCQTADDAGYSVGTRVLIAGYSEDGSADRGITSSFDTTSIKVRAANNAIRLVNGNDGSSDEITASRWKVIARVYE